MQRHPQWEQRLHDFVAKSLDTSHNWSAFDCLVGLASGSVQAVTGRNHARGHHGKYKSVAGAYRYLKQQFGVETPEQLLDSLFPLKAVGFAQRGDLVLCSVDAVAGADGEAVPGEVPGLCMGDFAFVAGIDGLQRVPRGDRWLKAWAVGNHHSGEAANG